jgi:RsiW-degrading membrane proteinase PrsW (M82 family)
MGSLDVAVAGACLLSGIGWVTVGAWRVPGGSFAGAARALLGGGAAFGIALGSYLALEALGLEVSWDRVLAGGSGAVVLAAAIGLVEEAAKLAGIALAVVRPDRRGEILRATLGVAAGFAALEGVVALSGVGPGVALARALLAPVAHAVLAAPLGLALAASARGGRRAALWLVPGLLASATLHAAADLSLAAPRFGRIGYAAALLVPALLVFVHARRTRTGSAAR